MTSGAQIQRLLPRLRLLRIHDALYAAADSQQTASKATKELKRLLSAAIEENAVSDETIQQTADCLYDLKACDAAAGARVSRAVELRPNLYTRTLSGGVLWSFYVAGGWSTRRKKAIKSSCAAALNAFLDDLLAIQTDSARIANLDSVFRNLIVVGQCYRLPVSTRARLEQALLDARDSLVPALGHSQAIVNYVSALHSLRVRNETVAEDAATCFVTAASNHEMLSVGSLTKCIKLFQHWSVGPVGAERSVLDILTAQLLTPPPLLAKSPSALVKLYVAASRVPSTGVPATRRGIVPNTDESPDSRPDGEATTDESAPPASSNGVRDLSSLLLSHCCGILRRCNGRNLLLLYNSLSHHLLRDVKTAGSSSGGLSSCVRLVSAEVSDALALDASAEKAPSGPPLKLYDKHDLATLRRAAQVIGAIVDTGPTDVTKSVERLLIQRFGVDPNTGK